MWKIKAASQNFSQGKQVYHSSSAKIKYSKNQELFCLENHERISLLFNWSNLQTKRTLIWTVIHIAAPAIMINLKSGLTLLESPAGTWYLQMLHVLSQVMLLRKSLAQEKTQHEGWMAFHPFSSWWFSYGSSEKIKKKKTCKITVTLTLFSTELKKKFQTWNQKNHTITKNFLLFSAPMNRE